MAMATTDLLGGLRLKLSPKSDSNQALACHPNFQIPLFFHLVVL